MPGLIEAHYHPTYFNVAALEDLDIKYPVEYVTLLAAANAKLALECGYTSARSGGSLFNIDVWLAKAIDEDLMPGPRLSPSAPCSSIWFIVYATVIRVSRSTTTTEPPHPPHEHVRPSTR